MEYSIAFIGYGEAAYNISKGMQSTKPAKMIAFDIMWNDPVRGPLICQRMKEVDVVCASSIQEAYENAKFIVSLNSTATAVRIASEIIGKLKPGQVFIDMNSTSPMSMEEIDQLPRLTGVRFCDASLLGSVPARKHMTKMVLSGDGTEEFYEYIKDYSPNVIPLKNRAGSASAIKMFKSVFSKGFPQLLLESLVPAAAYGVMDIVFDSFKHTFDDLTIEQFADRTVYRTLIHAKRRSEETREVAETIEAMGFSAEVSRAACARLDQLANYNYKERIGASEPNLREVVQMILKDYRPECRKSVD